MNLKERNKKIVRAIELSWESLQSHLKYTHSTPKIKNEKYKKVLREYFGGNKFHIQCVKEYSEIISILASLLQ